MEYVTSRARALWFPYPAANHRLTQYHFRIIASASRTCSLIILHSNLNISQTTQSTFQASSRRPSYPRPTMPRFGHPDSAPSAEDRHGPRPHASPSTNEPFPQEVRTIATHRHTPHDYLELPVHPGLILTLLQPQGPHWYIARHSDDVFG